MLKRVGIFYQKIIEVYLLISKRLSLTLSKQEATEVN